MHPAAVNRLQVALLTLGSPDRMTGGYLFHRRIADRAARHDADLRFVSIPNLALPWAAAAGPAWLADAHLRRADAVVLDSIAAAPAAPWLHRIRVPIVAMIHQPLGGMEGASMLRAIRRPLDRWAYRQADALLVASEWLGDELARDLVRGSLEVLPPGKDAGTLAPASPPGADLRMGRRMAVACVANWLPRKGIVELLDAVAMLPDELVTLHLAGDSAADHRYARRVSARLQRSDLRDRVVVHGVIAPDEVERMYRFTDAFDLPSFVEPYGTVWGEAMAAGLPVVGWRTGNLPYLADHEREALLVPVDDVRALSRAIGRLARDPELRRRMGSAAAERASERPTWDAVAERFFAVIREVIHNTRDGSPPGRESQATER